MIKKYYSLAEKLTHANPNTRMIQNRALSGTLLFFLYAAAVSMLTLFYILTDYIALLQ